MGRERESFVDDLREADWRACPHCGTRVQRVARRCLACHQDLEAEEPNSSEDPAPSRAATLSRPRGARGAWLTLALVIPCAALACVGAIYFILWLTNSLGSLSVGS